MEKREKIEQAVKERERVRLDAIPKKWNKREEYEFLRVLTGYGVDLQAGVAIPTPDWSRFRAIAKLDRKSDEALCDYYKVFIAMCKRQAGVRLTEEEKGLEGIIEDISEDHARLVLDRLELLSKLKEVGKTAINNDRLLLCENNYDTPDWWESGKHDKELIRAVVKHGLYQSEQNIFNDPEFSFIQSECAFIDELKQQYINSRQTEKNISQSDKTEPECIKPIFVKDDTKIDVPAHEDSISNQHKNDLKLETKLTESETTIDNKIELDSDNMTENSQKTKQTSEENETISKMELERDASIERDTGENPITFASKEEDTNDLEQNNGQEKTSNKDEAIKDQEIQSEKSSGETKIDKEMSTDGSDENGETGRIMSGDSDEKTDSAEKMKNVHNEPATDLKKDSTDKTVEIEQEVDKVPASNDQELQSDESGGKEEMDVIKENVERTQEAEEKLEEPDSIETDNCELKKSAETGEKVVEKSPTELDECHKPAEKATSPEENMTLGEEKDIKEETSIQNIKSEDMPETEIDEIKIKNEIATEQEIATNSNDSDPNEQKVEPMDTEEVVDCKPDPIDLKPNVETLKSAEDAEIVPADDYNSKIEKPQWYVNLNKYIVYGYCSYIGI